MSKKITLKKPKKKGKSVKLTAFKYNGGQLYTLPQKQGLKMVINVDWFEINLSNFLSDSIVVDGVKSAYIGSYGVVNHLNDNGIRFEPRDYGTKQFEKMYDVFLHGEHFAEIRTDVREGVRLNPNTSILKLRNDVLYQKGWVVRLEYIISELNLKVNNLTRLDIAVDAVNSRLQEQYLMYNNGTLSKTGKATFHCKMVERKLQVGYIGKRDSKKMILIYDKSAELKESEKGYIKGYWLDNNLIDSMDSEQSIERIEMSMRLEAVRDIDNFDWALLEKPEYLAGIFAAQNKRLYELVEPDKEGEKKGNVSRKHKIQPFDYSYFEALDIKRLNRKKVAQPVWAAKRAITFDMQEASADLTIQEDLFSVYSKCLKRAEKYGVVDWFQSKVEKWKVDTIYHKLMKEAVKEADNRRNFRQ